MPKLGTWVKAFIAFLAPISGTLATVAVDPDVTAVVPPGVLGAVTAGSSILAGVVAYLVRNRQTVDTIDLAIEKGDVSLSDLMALLDKWKQDR
jgi:hypothetical protein